MGIDGDLRIDSIRLRSARAGDARLLWRWTNDPLVRRASFHQARIPWEEHVKWFRNRLRDPSTRIYIASDGHGSPFGVVRFQETGTAGCATVSLSLAGHARGQGLGTRVLLLAVRKARRETGITRFIAQVKQENEASLRVFRNAGFRDTGLRMIGGQEAQEMVLESGPGDIPEEETVSGNGV